METKCSVCGTILDDSLKEYGRATWPLCWDCYCEVQQTSETYYGIGPHHHDLSITGSLVGSTVLDDQNDPNFHPDPDAPGLGVWQIPTPKGWK